MAVFDSKASMLLWTNEMRPAMQSEAKIADADPAGERLERVP
jgi:hypothetical protein